MGNPMLSYQKIQSMKNHQWVIFIHGMGGSSNAFKKQIEAYQTKYNLLLIDLHGHGKSVKKPLCELTNPTFKGIVEDIIEVMDFEKIYEAHFVGLSLGSLIIRAMVDVAPQRMISITCAGAVLDYNWKIKSLLFLGNLAIRLLPYMLLYKIFALIMLPRKNHKKSREIFVKEAQKLGSNEFFTWFKIVQNFNEEFPVGNLKTNDISKLLIMGAEDHMFLDFTKKYSKIDNNTSLHIIKNCGHIANIEAAEEFNRKSLEFIDSIEEVTSYQEAQCI